MNRPWRCEQCCWWKQTRVDPDQVRVGKCHAVAVGNDGVFPQRVADDFCPGFTPEMAAPWAGNVQANVGLPPRL